jgi:hypothetical protein
MLEKEKREQMTVAAQRTDFAGAWQKGSPRDTSIFRFLVLVSMEGHLLRG